MSLEDLLKPAKWVDREVHARYMEIGQKIPEKNLYKVTTALQFIGLIPAILYTPNAFKLPLALLFAFDMSKNLFSLENTNTLKYAIEPVPNEEPFPVEKRVMSYEKIKKIARLPLVLIGTAALIKAGADITYSILNQQPIDTSDYFQIAGGLGYICLASSIYLKDKDEDLLKREPKLKKIKAFFVNIYEGIKPKIAGPIAEPAALIAYPDRPS